jgi:hypothetical protein
VIAAAQFSAADNANWLRIRYSRHEADWYSFSCRHFDSGTLNGAGFTSGHPFLRKSSATRCEETQPK